MMTTLSIDAAAGSAISSTGIAPISSGDGVTPISERAPKDVSSDAAALFKRALEEQTVANAALDETLRAALASVSASLEKVTEVTESTGTSSTSQLPALSDQVAQNAALGTTLSESSTTVSETLAALGGSVDAGNVVATVREEAVVTPTTTVETPVVQTTVETVVETPVVSVTSQTVAETPVASVTAQTATVETSPLPALPDQVAQNAALGTTLAENSTTVSETIAALGGISDGATVVTSVTEETIVTPSTSVEAPVAPVTTQTVTVETATVETSPLPSLPDQVAQNAALGTTLSESSTTVRGTIAALGGTADSGNVVAPVREEAVVATSSTTAETPLVQTAVVQDDEPLVEANADALVAAGVAPAAAPAVTATPSVVETPAVAAVDGVQVSAASAVSSDVLVQAASAVADTLLVSPSLLRGQGEVVVQLKPDVLDGSTVSISVTGRELEVVFQPKTVDMAVMIENCRTQIAEHLASRIVRFNVSVDVRKKKS